LFNDLWGAFFVVRISPLLYLGLSIRDRKKPMFVKAFISDLPVKALNEGIVRGFPGTGMLDDDVVLFSDHV